MGHKDLKTPNMVDFDLKNSKSVDVENSIIASQSSGTGSPAPQSPHGGAGFSRLKTVPDHLDLVNWDLHLCHSS